MRQTLSTIVTTSLLTLFGLLTLADPARASLITYQAVLLGSNEAVPNDSPASGLAILTIDDAVATMQVEISFTGLVGGSPVAAHIHCCTMPPFTGAALIAIGTPTLPGFPTGSSGTYSHFFDLLDGATLRPTLSYTGFMLGLFNGQAYVNIRTQAFPGGEIRGFLMPATETPAAVPEPATLTLLGVGLAVLARRRAAGPSSIRVERRPAFPSEHFPHSVKDLPR